MAYLQDIFESLDKSTDEKTLWNNIYAAFSSLGYDKTVFIFGSKTQHFAASNLNENFRNYYKEKNLIRIDPFIQHSLKNPLPMRTGVNFLENYPSITKEEYDFAYEVGEAGFKSGLSVNLSSVSDHCFGGWNIGGDLTRKESVSILKQQQANIILLSQYAYQCIIKKRKEVFLPLTDREYDCLNYCAIGLNYNEIANKLGISLRTVEFHLKNSREKLQAKNQAHAIAIAIQYKLINPFL